MEPRLRRSMITEFSTVLQMKVALVSGSVGTRSLRDFGGLYLVHGRYSLKPAVALRAEFVSMIDLTPHDKLFDEIKNARVFLPMLKVEFFSTDFRNPALYETLTPVDTSILFDVLLHQENYVSVLQGVASKTERYICIAQPCLKETEYSRQAASLLQFWPEPLKDEYRRGTYWPKEPRVERFDTRYWVWGHTVSHFVALMYGLGWDVDDGEVVDGMYGEHWEYALLRFCRRVDKYWIEVSC